MAEETEDSLRLELGGDTTERSGDPQNAFDTCGPGDADVLGSRVRELVNMAESMPAEVRRLLELKSVTRKTLEMYATSVREFCVWSGLSAGSDVEAPDLDGLLVQFMNLQFSEVTRPGKARSSWPVSSSFQPSRS